MTEFIRLPSRIINLSQIREISFQNCETTIYWHNGQHAPLPDIDAAILLDTLEQRYGLCTDPADRYWWEELEDSNHIAPLHPPDSVHTTA